MKSEELKRLFPKVEWVEVGKHLIPKNLSQKEKIQDPFRLVFPYPKGVLRISGKDRISFLQGLTTQDLNKLVEAKGLRSLFCSNKGKILFDTFLLKFDTYLLIVTDPGQEEKLLEFLSFYNIVEEIQISDISHDFIVWYCLSEDKLLSNKQELIWDLYSNSPNAVRVFMEINDGDLIKKFQNANCQFIGLEEFDQFRPLFDFARAGIDFGDQNLPHEARLEHCVDFKKGCFIGQEPVARLEHRGKPNKILKQIRSKNPLKAADLLESEARQVGVVTTVSSLPMNGIYLSLAYIKNAYLLKENPGTIYSGDVQIVISAPVTS